MSKKVRIVRKAMRRYGIPPQVAADKVGNIGHYWLQGKPARPLSYEEEDKWMEQLVGLTVKDPGFRKAVESYYYNVTLRDNDRDSELEIGLDSNGNPLDLEDFIKWRHALKHPDRAENKDQCEAERTKLFWIEDPEEAKAKQVDTMGLNKKAYIELAKLSEDEIKLDWVLRSAAIKYSDQLGSIRDILKLKSEDKELKLDNIIKLDPVFFIEITKDSDLEYKAEIASLIESQVLKKEGTRYINGTESLGTLESTIAWMKDPNNAEEYAILKARLESFGYALKKKAKAEKETKK